MLLTLATVATVGAAYVLMSVYMRKAVISFRSADKLGAELSVEIRNFVESDAPPAVARLAIQLGAIAGCGCFVRGVLMSHYLPRVTVTRGRGVDPVQSAFDEADSMTADQQKAFGRITGMVIVYDSFRNPFQGWLFRRLLKSYLQPSQRWDSQLEAKLATFSVVSRRYAAAH